MNIINKYVWLVETIYRAHKISYEEINRKWLDDEDFSEGVELPLRTFHKWRIAVEEMFGLVIENEKRGEYRYYIENEDVITKGGMRSWMLNTISTSNLLLENRSLNDRILLEDVPSGREYLQPIIDAMKKKVRQVHRYKKRRKIPKSNRHSQVLVIQVQTLTVVGLQVGVVMVVVIITKVHQAQFGTKPGLFIL